MSLSGLIVIKVLLHVVTDSNDFVSTIVNISFAAQMTAGLFQASIAGFNYLFGFSLDAFMMALLQLMMSAVIDVPFKGELRGLRISINLAVTNMWSTILLTSCKHVWTSVNLIRPIMELNLMMNTPPAFNSVRILKPGRWKGHFLHSICWPPSLIQLGPDQCNEEASFGALLIS